MSDIPVAVQMSLSTVKKAANQLLLLRGPITMGGDGPHAVEYAAALSAEDRHATD